MRLFQSVSSFVSYPVVHAWELTADFPTISCTVISKMSLGKYGDTVCSGWHHVRFNFFFFFFLSASSPRRRIKFVVDRKPTSYDRLGRDSMRLRRRRWSQMSGLTLFWCPLTLSPVSHPVIWYFSLFLLLSRFFLRALSRTPQQPWLTFLLASALAG